MANIVDRRSESGSGGPNRDRFHKRYEEQIKRAIDKAIGDGTVTDIGRGGVDIKGSKKTVAEPTFHHGQGGVDQHVLPGNKEYKKGQRIPKPRGGGGGGGSGPGDPGDGENGTDDFTWHLSEDFVLDYILRDLGLPNLTKPVQGEIPEDRIERAGFSSHGPTPKRHLVRSKLKKIPRVLAAEKGPNDQIIALLEEEKGILSSYNDSSRGSLQENPDIKLSRRKKVAKLKTETASLKSLFRSAVSLDHAARIVAIEEEIVALEKKKRLSHRWNEGTDLRFRRDERKPSPVSKAVMFCVMDVSGSMDQQKKDNAKLYYFLLYQLLKRNYETIDVVFVRHTTEAEEVDEEEFFYSTVNGGTTVSTGLQKMLDIAKDRYPESEWNIYGAQASDGENSRPDNLKCVQLMREILGKAQAYFYTEVESGWYNGDDGLWDTYRGIKAEFPNKLWLGKIRARSDVLPIFREHFRKKGISGFAPESSGPSAFDPQ